MTPPPLDDLGEPRARLSPAIRDALHAGRAGLGEPGPPVVLGREEEAASALRSLESRPRGLTITGRPGSGASTLALLVARRWNKAHPGGRVAVVDLAGPDRRVHDAVRELLLSLGVALDALPARLEQQTKLLRATIKPEDIVVLDNFRRSEVADQLTELLPEAGRFIATARLRSKTPNVTATALRPEDSLTLLGREASTTETDGLIARCAGLPLALRLAAGGGDQFSIDYDDPIDFAVRLAALRVGEATGSSARSILKMLRSLVEIGGTADPEAAGAVWAMGEAAARQHLAVLEAAGVFYHDPARGLALRPALAEAALPDAPDGVVAAYVSLAGRKAGRGRAADVAWLDRQWPAVREAVRRSVRSGGPDFLETVSNLRRVAGILNRHHDLLVLDEIAQDAARSRGDQRSEAEALGRLAFDHYRTGAIDEAEAAAGEAVRRARAVGDPVLLAAQLIRASKLALARRLFDQAISGLEDAVHLARDGGDVPLEIDALLTAADCYRHVRNVEDAAGALSRVRHLLADRSPTEDDPGPWTRLARSYLELDLPQEAFQTLVPLLGDGTPANAPVALELIGEVMRREGDRSEAVRALSNAVELYREHGDEAGECRSLVALAKLTVEDDPLGAAVHLDQALDLARRSADLPHQARIWSELGNAFAAGGEVAEAMSAFDYSIATARELGDLHALALALAGRGRLVARLGHSADALATLGESFRLFESLGAVQETAAVSRDVADLLIAEGSADRAVDLMEQAVSRARDADDLPSELLNLGLLAKAYELAGMGEDARQAQSRARRLAGRLSQRSDVTEAVLSIVPLRLAPSGGSEAVERDLLTLVEQMTPGEPASVRVLQMHWRAAVTAFRNEDFRRSRHHLDQLVELASGAGADRLDMRSMLFTAYRGRADVSAATGEYEAARRDVERALAIARGGPEEQSEMLGLYLQLGDLVARTGDLRAAENYYRSALEFGDDTEGEDLHGIHARLGDLALSQGDLKAADARYRQALALAEARADGRPIGLYLRQLGDIARRAGRAREATQFYQRALDIARGVTAEAADDPNALRDLYVTLAALGQLSRDVEDYRTAVDYFRRGLEIVEQLTAALPGEATLRSDLAAAHRGLADTYREAADWDSAVRHYREALSAGESVMALDPDDVQAAREVSITHDSLALASADRGEIATALDHYQQSLEIAERLAATNPGNLLLQRDLVISHQNLAQALSTQGSMAQARRHMRMALDVAVRLSSQDPLNQDYRAIVATLEERVSGLSG
ncbi:tetratricopeptide repeat protein [Paractinoplanes atraurantiacus]|uniref:Anaphase-promoting complex subunit 5 n=1 Tax=Paractinoplanes atraurantiacus TaxID=1036182 RepID=A0A285ID80_9ACTN|nr:tetratricopeptide repeat protein [Actinoplanes atraurantiacus]SNY45929.1 Anaphase-promoting complex subunit 5 [Actinoplanes atraurantiacus]